MNIFKKIALINKITKTVKYAKEIIYNNSQLGTDVQKALLNLKADIEVLMGLLPSCQSVLGDIKVLIQNALK